jgi:glucose-1-phosphate thymidylyltransferase
MKGIILAGGSGTRLYPVTTVVSKQLLPVFDKPMIYYPLSTLMFAGIRDILIITTPQDQPLFERLLGNGCDFGLRVTYAIQETPRDEVTSAEQYGVVELNSRGQAISIEEKPTKPKSNIAVTGLYFYDNEVINIASNLKPSARGELEITDVNRVYMERGNLFVQVLGRGFAWLDTGTHASLVDASHFIQVLEERQKTRVACPEDIALRLGYINLDQFGKLAHRCAKSSYGQYLLSIHRTYAHTRCSEF